MVVSLLFFLYIYIYNDKIPKPVTSEINKVL